MKTKILFALACLLSSPAIAQETYAGCMAQASKRNWNQTQVAQCQTPAMRAELSAHFPSDLVDYFLARVLAISGKTDRRQITQDEARAEIMQARSQIISESQRRAALTQQSQSRGTVTYCLNGPSTICF